MEELKQTITQICDTLTEMKEDIKKRSDERMNHTQELIDYMDATIAAIRKNREEALR